jgi:fatty acid amide hydrolase 2
MQIPVAAANAARDRLDRTRDRLWESLRDFDALLLQPVPETAPRGLSSTGDQSYQTPWTAFHGPLAVVPGRFSDDGLPMAAMIAAAPGNDALAIGIASELEKRLDRLPAYVAEPGPEASAK